MPDSAYVDKRNSASEARRFTDIPEKQAKSSFALLTKLYGEERALDMVKALPICLAFDQKIFAANLKGFSEVFGLEESKDMVRRNPGLLAVTPANAATASDQTMQFSYLVAYTRPVSNILLPLLLFLLLSPGIEYFTGIPIRTTFLGFF
jgi:hypothetical protein